MSYYNPFNLSVWPNPFTDHLNLMAASLDPGSNTEVAITDVLGNTLKHVHFQNKHELNETLDLSEFSKGIYFLSLTNNQKRSVHKIVRD